MTRLPTFLASALMLLSATAATGGEETSVLVSTISPRRGVLPDVVTAYGLAAPALDSSMTISLQSQGRVIGFDVTAGEEVTAGQPLLRFAVSQSALGSFRQAETALQAARIDRTRVAQLLKQQLATKDQLAQADKLIADAQNTLETLKKSGADKPDLVIKAPFDGVVTTIPVAQGDTLAPGAPMMSLMRADGLVVKVGIEPTQRLRVKRGDPADLHPLTAGGAVAKGKVVRIDGLLNPRTHLIDTDVATAAHILPGAAYKAEIIVGSFAGVLVPRDAVLHEAARAHVFQVQDGKAKQVEVSVVGGDDAVSVVDGPIDPAAPIVVQGAYQLTEGMAVRFSPSAAANDAPAAR